MASSGCVFTRSDSFHLLSPMGWKKWFSWRSKSFLSCAKVGRWSFRRAPRRKVEVSAGLRVGYVLPKNGLQRQWNSQVAPAVPFEMQSVSLHRTPIRNHPCQRLSLFVNYNELISQLIEPPPKECITKECVINYLWRLLQGLLKSKHVTWIALKNAAPRVIAVSVFNPARHCRNFSSQSSRRTNLRTVPCADSSLN